MENLEDTLSINHNWLNGHNVAWGVSLLRKERAQAAAAIEDCRCLSHALILPLLLQVCVDFAGRVARLYCCHL